MMGSIVGAHDNYKTLRDLEGEAFGSTTASAAWQVRTRPSSAMTPQTAHLRMNDSTLIRKGKRTLRPARDAIGPGVKFKVELSFARADAVPLVLPSLWLFSMLGGLGNRARRGFGSLALTPDEQTTEAVQKLGLDFSYPDKPLKDIKDTLEACLKKAHGYFTSYAPTISSPPSAQFPVLSKAQAKLWLIKPQDGFWSSWSNAMNDLREHIYRGYKRSKRLQEIGSANPRLASPLIIQIKRAAQDKYFGVLLVFDEQHNKQQYLGANWSDFISFLNGLASYEHQEVTLP
jgi:CRISPR-associated protein Cmr1